MKKDGVIEGDLCRLKQSSPSAYHHITGLMPYRILLTAQVEGCFARRALARNDSKIVIAKPVIFTG